MAIRKISSLIGNNNNNKYYSNKEYKRRTIGEYAKQNNIDLRKAKNIKDTTGLFKGSEAFKGVTSAFDDGYQFGDGLKTALKGYNAFRKTTRDTSRDLATNIAKGFMYGAEGIADGLQYLTAGENKLRAKVLDFVGADKMAESYRKSAEAITKNADFNSSGALFGENEKQSDNLFEKGWTEKADKNSVIGDFGDSAAQGIGNVAAMAGGSYLLGGSSMATAFTSFSSGYGNARSEAVRNGLDEKSAHKAGVISGFAEAISEQIFDGMPGTKTAGWANKLTGKIGDGVTKFFNEKTGKIVFKALNTMGEGTEEVVSNALNTLGSSITHLIDNDFTYGLDNSRILKDGYQFGDITKDTFDSVFSKESLEAFISATLTSCIINGGKNVMSNTQKNKIINAYAEDNGISFKEAKNQLESAI